MADPVTPRRVTELEALKALAHPRRQRILTHLATAGPSTSATLARSLGLNTGATSYHLRELARHGFVEEVPERAHGRERWWRNSTGDLRFPMRSEQDPQTRRVLDEMTRQSYAEDMEDFRTSQAEVEPGGEWGDAYPYSRGTIQVSLEQLRDFFEDYIALINRYSPHRSDSEPEPGSRIVRTRFLAYPAPRASDEAPAPEA